MKRRRWLGLVVAAGWVVAAGAAPAPTGDLGRFTVAAVLVDPALDNNQQRYFVDDPRLLGRLVTVEPGRLLIDSEPPCTEPARRWSRRTITELIRSFSQRRGQDASVPPNPGAYGLSGVPAGPIPVVTYQCTGPRTAAAGGIPGHGWSGAIGFPLDGGRRALWWSDEVILILRRAQADRSPAMCAKAANPSERAICADPSLSGWDRSVNVAYRLNRDGSRRGDGWAPAEDQAALQAGQRRWLVERDRCGADHDCLLDRMAERTDALMRRQY